MGGQELGEGWGGSGGARVQDEVRGGQGAERRGQGEGLVEEDREGDDLRAWVMAGSVGEVAVGGLEDEGGELRIVRAEVDRERCSEAGAVDDDGVGRDGAGGGEVGEGGGSVGLHGCLGGVRAEGLAVATVVEEQDVEVLGVEDLGGRECVGEVAIS